ncbi:MAG: PQQ-binding-like beta-propeller repeat protein [Planctomycetota bacterium]|nr:PQQ-binding-like beta-propeller repeat protein [Planctomycetota bacterium]
MNRPIPPQEPEEQQRYAERCRTAVLTAAVAAAFSLIVIALLAVNYTRAFGVKALDSVELREMKAQLAKDPRNAELKDRIRAFDMSLRDDYFRRQTRAARGAWLLVAGGAVLFLALHLAAAYRPAPPLPRPPLHIREILRELSLSRVVVALLSVVFLGGAAALLVGPYGGLPPGAVDAGIASAVPEAPPTDEEMAQNWPRFRGPNGLGIAPFKDIPVSWNGKTGENIRWKVELPLPGAGSPIVWGNRLFLTGATATEREVYCLDTETGAMVWKQRVEKVPASPKQPPADINKDTGFAASTAATDGRRVYAVFANGDLVACDFSGKRVWARNLGLPKNRFGHAASLLTYKKFLIIPWDHETNARVMAVDCATGATVWDTRRDMGSAWTTPVVIPLPGGDQLITAANPRIVAYDVAGGKEIWSVTGLEGDVAPSPVYGAGLVFVGTAHAAFFAIKPDGKGDVTKTHVAWRAEDGLPDACSPLTDGKLVWLLTSEGILTCLDAGAGKVVYAKELELRFYASPSLVEGRLFLLTMTGEALFATAGREFKVLHKAALGEATFASPAFQDGRIYIRGKKHVFCISAGGGKKE